MGWIDRCMESCKKWDTLLARLLLGGYFTYAGVMKFMGIAGFAGMLEGLGLPMAMVVAYLVAALETLGGLAIITGFFFRYAAMALAIFTALVIVLVHSDWSDPMAKMLAMKDAGILAAFLYMMTYGPGPLALGEKKFVGGGSSAPSMGGTM